jgi:hypothetical protein
MKKGIEIQEIDGDDLEEYFQEFAFKPLGESWRGRPLLYSRDFMTVNEEKTHLPLRMIHNHRITWWHKTWWERSILSK